jgi:hypothetical protein
MEFYKDLHNNFGFVIIEALAYISLFNDLHDNYCFEKTKICLFQIFYICSSAN